LLADVDSEVIKAYSTYLHETVHWWQHIGSTSGLLLSLSFLGQTHPGLSHLRNAVAEFGAFKSLKSWTDKILRSEGSKAQAKLYHANIAVNNALDVEYYKWFAFAPKTSAPRLIEQQHFESVGHSYHIAYGHLLSMLSDTIDPTFAFLPDARAWDARFKGLNDQRVHGHYWRSPIQVPPLGLHAIYEGQARFTQLQFLDRTHENSPTCDEWRAKGYLGGIYVTAFEKFLELSGCNWPETIDDPIVNLFLLICDLAINPTVGFPFDVESSKASFPMSTSGFAFAASVRPSRSYLNLRMRLSIGDGRIFGSFSAVNTVHGRSPPARSAGETEVLGRGVANYSGAVGRAADIPV
jgi:hypothetical protein